MRLRTSASENPRAAMVLMKLGRLTLAEAKLLLTRARVLPLELTKPEAEAAARELSAGGVGVELLEVPLTSSRCGAHLGLTGDRPCNRCRESVCPLCVDAAGEPLCRRCASAQAHSARWKWRRVAVLMVVLVVTAGLAARQLQRRSKRVSWNRPLAVSVVLHSDAPVSAEVRRAWRTGLSELERWFSTEAERLGAPLEHPIRFTLSDKLVTAPLPEAPEPTGAWFADTVASLAFRRALEGLVDPGGDVRLLVTLGREGSTGWVEGLADRGGEVGLVRVGDGQSLEPLSLELVAVAHEALHCLNADDAYLPDGRAKVPEGLAEPDKSPRFPQRYAEVMAGEIPDDERRGHVPRTLADVRIGPTTAQAIGWTPL